MRTAEENAGGGKEEEKLFGLEGLSDGNGVLDEGAEEDEFAMKVIAGFRPVIIQDHRPLSGKGKGEHGVDIATACKDLKGARRFFEWLIAPVSLKQFYAEFWERKPLVIQRSRCREYYEGWLSKADIAQLLSSHHLTYGTNVDVTNYSGGQRQTLNGEGEVDPAEVWSHYASGCSVRLLHPQRWVDPLWLMLSTLEAHFNCVVGCNTYLTPPGAQGFSPHYDDIEAFILQTEGKKRWRLYAPRGTTEVLPRFSSPNFEQTEVGEAVADIELAAGDFLYMPRGTIHQAVSASDTHSLHVTVSTGQRNSWAEFLELAMPRAIQLACEDHAWLRESLPRDFITLMGVTKADADGDPKRGAVMTRLTEAMEMVFQSGPWDSAADQMALNFLRARLPLPPSAHTKAEGGGEVRPTSVVRLVFPGVARLAVEEECAVLYHMMDNSRAMHSEALWGLVGEEREVEEGSGGEGEGRKRKGCEVEGGKESKRVKGEDTCCGEGEEGNNGEGERGERGEKGRLEFNIEYAEALERICEAFPRGFEVRSMPLDSKKECLQLARELVRVGVLVVDK